MHDVYVSFAARAPYKDHVPARTGPGEGLLMYERRDMSRSRAKSARFFSDHENVAKRAKFGRSYSLAPAVERRRSAMGEYLGERPLSAACE